MFAPTSTHSSNNLSLSKPKRGCPLLEPVAKSVSDRPNRSPAHEYKSYKCSRRLRPTHQTISRYRSPNADALCSSPWQNQFQIVPIGRLRMNTKVISVRADFDQLINQFLDI